MRLLTRLSTVCLALLLMAATAEAQRGGGGMGGFHGGGSGIGGFHGGGGFHGDGGFHGGGPMFRGNPGFRPGFNPGFRPGFNPGFRHGFNPGFRGFHSPSVVITPFFGFPYFSSPIVPFDSGTIYTAPTYIAPDQTTPSGDETMPLAGGDQQSTLNSVDVQKATSITLILKDGRRIEAPGYALVGSTLWILDSQGATKISLSDVDVDATQKENLKQGINVVIPPAS
jgi:hypothetical protein